MEEAKLEAEYYVTKPTSIDGFLAVGPMLRCLYEQALVSTIAGCK
jgi:hypothetical protein